MGKYKKDFEKGEREIHQVLGVLRDLGVNVNLTGASKNQISETTLFDGDDRLFKELIHDCLYYYEYGCGKSTEYAYKYTESRIFSVDTSQEWARRIVASLGANTPGRLNLEWVNVGPLGNWGTPTSFQMRENFVKYGELLWRSNNPPPNLVLIDGRFRIFCFLTTLEFAPLGTKILFDDYLNRPYYHVAEEFCPVIETCGRQALFEVDYRSKAKVNYQTRSLFQNVIG